MESRFDDKEINELEKISKQFNNVPLSTLMIQYHVLVARQGYTKDQALSYISDKYKQKEGQNGKK